KKANKILDRLMRFDNIKSIDPNDVPRHIDDDNEQLTNPIPDLKTLTIDNQSDLHLNGLTKMMTSILMTPDLYDPTLDKEYFIRDLYSTLSNLDLNESINSYVLNNSLYKYSSDFNIDRNTFYEHSYSYRFNSRVYGK